jgi:hypothetical protein
VPWTGISGPVPGGCTLTRMTTDSGSPGQGGPADPAAVLADRLFHDVIGAPELFTVYLGERLGLYRARRGGWVEQRGDRRDAAQPVGDDVRQDDEHAHSSAREAGITSIRCSGLQWSDGITGRDAYQPRKPALPVNGRPGAARITWSPMSRCCASIQASRPRLTLRDGC